MKLGCENMISLITIIFQCGMCSKTMKNPKTLLQHLGGKHRVVDIYLQFGLEQEGGEMNEEEAEFGEAEFGEAEIPEVKDEEKAIEAEQMEIDEVDDIQNGEEELDEEVAVKDFVEIELD